MTKTSRPVPLALAATAIALAFTVVPQVAPAQDTGKLVLVSGDLSDPFFGAIKRGADDAARDLGVTYTYLPAAITAVDMGKAIDAAIASKPAGLAFGDWFPDTQDAKVKALAATGVPVVGYNSGPDNWQDSTGAIAWVKQSDYEAGELAGQRFSAAGIKHALCVNHGPGAALFDQRCDGLEAGMKAGGGTATELSLPYSDATNPAKVMQAVQGALSGDASIDAVFTLGSGIARDALRAIGDMPGDRKVVVGTIDLSSEVLQQVADGNLMFAIDQQPYLQGYYAIQILAQDLKYGVHPVGIVKTGPLAITKDDAARTMEINGREKGIRGAL